MALLRIFLAEISLADLVPDPNSNPELNPDSNPEPNPDSNPEPDPNIDPDPRVSGSDLRIRIPTKISRSRILK